MRTGVVLFGVLLILASCQRSPYDGYKRLADDIHLHYLALGDGYTIATDSDSVRVRLRMGWRGGGVGELFSTEGLFAVKDIRSGALSPVLRRMHEGDSMSVIAPAKAWPWSVIAGGLEVEIPDTGMIQVEVAMIALRTPAMFRAEQERFRRNDPLGYEQRLINAYRSQRDSSFQRWGTSDLYFRITGTAVDTARVVQGDHVTISYNGQRMEDGFMFDDTDRNGEPLSFRFGDKDQVIQGLEVAVSLLREGQSGSFLFPSAFAFGAKGVPNVIDPFTPVVYEVRLEKVERGVRAAR